MVIHFIQLFEREMCLQQLRYSGMMETVKIRIAGYPIRLPFRDFIDRYRVLLPSLVARSKNSDSYTLACTMGRVLMGDKDWQAGRTKMFIKVYRIGPLKCMSADGRAKRDSRTKQWTKVNRTDE